MWEKEYAFYRVKVDGGANVAGLGSRLCSKQMEKNGESFMIRDLIVYAQSSSFVMCNHARFKTKI